MNQTSDQQLFITQLLDGIEISDSDKQQLEGMMVLSQIKSAVELVMGLSPDRKVLLDELTALLSKYVGKMEPKTRELYLTAIQKQMEVFATEIVKRITPVLKPEENQRLQANLANLLS
jgi:hypothetical protein